MHRANFHEWKEEGHVPKHSAQGCRNALTSRGVGWSARQHPETGGKRWGFQEPEGVWTCLLKGKKKRHGVYTQGTIMRKSQRKAVKCSMPFSNSGIGTAHQRWRAFLKISTPGETIFRQTLQLKTSGQGCTHGQGNSHLSSLLMICSALIISSEENGSPGFQCRTENDSPS